MLINTRALFRFIDNLNISIIILVMFLSFISLYSQRQWTILYSSMIEIKNKNNNMIDYISKTEQYFLNEIELKDNIKKTNPEDLIYLVKTNEKEKENILILIFKEILKGFDDGKYQRGY